MNINDISSKNFVQFCTNIVKSKGVTHTFFGGRKFTATFEINGKSETITASAKEIYAKIKNEQSKTNQEHSTKVNLESFKNFQIYEKSVRREGSNFKEEFEDKLSFAQKLLYNTVYRLFAVKEKDEFAIEEDDEFAIEDDELDDVLPLGKTTQQISLEKRQSDDLKGMLKFIFVSFLDKKYDRLVSYEGDEKQNLLKHIRDTYNTNEEFILPETPSIATDTHYPLLHFSILYELGKYVDIPTLVSTKLKYKRDFSDDNVLAGFVRYLDETILIKKQDEFLIVDGNLMDNIINTIEEFLKKEEVEVSTTERETSSIIKSD
ncbi:MAG: hypothetical protein CMO81_09560 [Waddliaceae bacterium]|nr:hypothetical protein [Waddliaceae bacterium]